MKNIKIERDDSSVKLTFEDIIGYNLTTSIETSSPFVATLLTKELKEQIWDKIKYIRKKAYEEGWEDKTKRKCKRDYFSGNFTPPF